MEFKRGRYSWILRPILITYDLFVLNIFAYYLLNFNDENLRFFSLKIFNNKYLLYFIYSVILWLVSTYFLKFYKVYRYTSLLNIISLIFRQFFVYGFITFAFVGVFRSINIQAIDTIKYLVYAFGAIALIKLLSYYVLKSVRVYLKGNLRNIVVIGKGDSVKQLKKIFLDKKELGYKIIGVFNNEAINNDGTIKDSFSFLEGNNRVDEIYCAIDELTEKQINEYVRYANLNHCNIKFIPNSNKLFTKRLKIDFYNYVPVLSIQEVALNNELNKFLKRSFDIIFSLFIIIFVLSWLSVILFILIKLESKGPLFYKHKRTGINYKEFYCYKFRSLKTTKEVKGTYVKKDDKRVTAIGKFLRKTSLDELPQFINVLKGDMSVVGPRPHMLSYTDDYSKKINKYNFIFRHNVKPGITGLAQIKGYRGEIKLDKDIINRIKYDIFYIENWSILLDIKIIFKTIVNFIKGDDKAY
ncbi:exopolysaccharide biosynthesis polyprenyl glycosylphosphotransferase [Psychroserpens luteus]|uniref:Exopolysaccharide biosynthesis polyprenyl glycosylphosphotransferase n=1 Tax=Psychroserpens luteus TaxID=1434066 RepID=A0ABW5ZZ92_9FLAO|nr:exopolysaccharide biosynthesis polyprenyl glycosylphosphotransferase [Psychroserpens luteus]